ncbi:MAG: helix-turn-helix domain-containing protein [Monoglobaceae bacterium]|nr:AraC family transcriptional regulator [Clostridia bacterium]HCB95389.1 hypothetical protein [Ruminococcus sp.]
MIADIKVTFCTYFKKIDKFIYPSEIYDEYTAFCLKQGCFSYRIGNGEEKTIYRGEFVICPPGKPFFRKVIDSIELCMIKFVCNEFDVFSNSIKVNDVLRYNYNLSKLEDCIFCGDMESQPIFSHYCRDIIYMLNESSFADRPFAEEKKYIENNYNKNISISELAKNSGYSVVHFINKFKSIYGCTPGQYLSDIRLRKAKELLACSYNTSKEVAFMCGFNDELYFIRFFKKHMGITPKEFRKNHIL